MTSGPTIREVLAADNVAFDASRVAEDLRKGVALTELREHAWVRKLGSSDQITRALLREFDRVCELPFVDILGAAWSKLEAVHKYKKDPAKTGVVSLKEWKFDWSYQQSVDLEFIPHGPKFSVPLEARLSGSVAALTLSIREARVVEIGSAECTLSVTFALLGTEIWKPREFHWRLPATLPLSPGLPVL
jgi:hypothetical protein